MERYLNNVRDKGAKLAALREPFLQGDPRAEEIIRSVAHDLHGSGAAFGYPELSLAGKGVEHALPDALPDYLATLLDQIDRICAPAPQPDPPSERTGKLSVLVAESNTINASIIGNRISKLADVAECMVVNSAVEACDRLVRGGVDLLILDLVLPDADGREILRDIKKVLGVDIPTLVMSGVSNDLLYMECMKMGASSYLTKPFDTDALVQETAKLVRLRRLQLQTPAAAGAGKVKSPAVEQPRGTQSLEGQHVLIADDDALQADLIGRRLVGEGAQVTHCRDGQETLDFLKEHPVSIVILDVRMPLVDGFRVLEKIRGEPRLTDLPVIMLTAMGSEEDVIRGYDLGANDYILKPYSQAQLIGRIRGLLKRAGRQS